MYLSSLVPFSPQASSFPASLCENLFTLQHFCKESLPSERVSGRRTAPPKDPCGPGVSGVLERVSRSP